MNWHDWPVTETPAQPAPGDRSTSPSVARDVRRWWEWAVTYQIYVRSFADSNGDGIGDLPGISARIPYLRELGVDAIWLTPCFPSPQFDHGYDVADYCDIEPAYGTLADFDHLVATSKAHDMRVLLDIVPNHCSIEHPWFKRALAAGPGSEERDWFYFRDGTGIDGSAPPNNWRSLFGGPAWHRTTNPDGSPGQWYLHMFAPEQPDLNWGHESVPQAFDDALRFWFDRGVDGFRVDAVLVVGKQPLEKDTPPFPDDAPPTDVFPHQLRFGGQVHTLMERWRALADAYEATHPGRELVFVSEAYADIDELATYVGPTRFHTSFEFDLLLCNWQPDRMRAYIDNAMTGLGGRGLPMTWTINNHDTQRSATRMGHTDAHRPSSFTDNNLLHSDEPVDPQLGLARSNALVLVTAALPGSMYLYYGEELGLPEVLDLPEWALQDPIWLRSEHTIRGRDGCRVPFPWTTDPATNFGFSTPPGAANVAQSWLPQPSTWGNFAASGQLGDPASVLTLYRTMLDLRARHLRDPSPANFSWLPSQPTVIAFRNASISVIANLGDDPVDLHPYLATGRVVLRSNPLPDANDLLPGDAVWILENPR